jgi:CRP-like cAMP-binding protein
MSDQQLPSDVKKRVLTYYEYLWERNKGVDSNSLFDDMPLCMKAEVYLNVAQDVLEKIPLFEGVEASFMRNLAVRVRPTLFLPGDYILREGDTALGMYCLKRGKVDVLDDNERVIRTFGKGDFFSDESLIRALPSQYSFRAATAVDALLLLKTEVDTVLIHYPEIQKRVNDWQLPEQQSSKMILDI